MNLYEKQAINHAFLKLLITAPKISKENLWSDNIRCLSSRYQLPLRFIEYYLLLFEIINKLLNSERDY